MRRLPKLLSYYWRFLNLYYEGKLGFAMLSSYSSSFFLIRLIHLPLLTEAFKRALLAVFYML